MSESTGQAVEQSVLIARQLKLARWRAAEDQLYPLVTVDPDSYMRAVTAVGEVGAALRTEYTEADPLFALDIEEWLVNHAAELPRLAEAGLPPKTIAEAALAQVAAMLPRPSSPNQE